LSPISAFTCRIASNTSGKRPSLGSGKWVGRVLSVASGWVATEGGVSSDQSKLQPKISASICRSNTTGMPSGSYKRCTSKRDSTSLSVSVNTSRAEKPFNLPACTPAKGTHTALQTGSCLKVLNKRSFPDELQPITTSIPCELLLKL